MPDYYTQYQLFLRYSNHPASVVRAIRHLSLHSSKDLFVLVDVGSNDGCLTAKVLDYLERRFSSVKTFSLEPDVAPCSRLRARFSGKSSVVISSEPWAAWIAQHKHHLSGSVDFLLNSQTFYHYRPSDWCQILTDSDALLSTAGLHSIVIDSSRTSYHELRGVLSQKIFSTIGEYGQFLVGDDVGQYLLDHSVRFHHKTIKEPITIPMNKSALGDFIQILGFVFRFDPRLVSADDRNTVRKFMESYRQRDTYQLPRYQDMFIIPKQAGYEPLSNH